MRSYFNIVVVVFGWRLRNLWRRLVLVCWGVSAREYAQCFIYKYSHAILCAYLISNIPSAFVSLRYHSLLLEVTVFLYIYFRAHRTPANQFIHIKTIHFYHSKYYQERLWICELTKSLRGYSSVCWPKSVAHTVQTSRREARRREWSKGTSTEEDQFLTSASGLASFTSKQQFSLSTSSPS